MKEFAEWNSLTFKQFIKIIWIQIILINYIFIHLQNMTLIIIQNFGFYFQINRTEATMSTDREVLLRPSQNNLVYIGHID